MKDLDILEYIATTGKCPSGVCDRCPLAKLKKREETDVFLSCYTVIVNDLYPNYNLDDAYKNKAKQVLMSIMIELALGGSHENE